jgi:hypothetical protein
VTFSVSVPVPGDVTDIDVEDRRATAHRQDAGARHPRVVVEFPDHPDNLSICLCYEERDA